MSRILLAIGVIIVGTLIALALVDSEKELNRGPYTTTTTANHVQTTITNPTSTPR